MSALSSHPNVAAVPTPLFSAMVVLGMSEVEESAAPLCFTFRPIDGLHEMKDQMTCFTLCL